MTTDDFDRTSQSLGPNWVDAYDGEGSGKLGIATDGQRVQWQKPYSGQFSVTTGVPPFGEPWEYKIYGSMPDADGNAHGAILRPDTVCAACHRRPEKGHMFDVTMGPNMSGTFRHRDCDDPTLAKGEGE